MWGRQKKGVYVLLSQKHSADCHLVCWAGDRAPGVLLGVDWFEGGCPVLHLEWVLSAEPTGVPGCWWGRKHAAHTLISPTAQVCGWVCNPTEERTMPCLLPIILVNPRFSHPEIDDKDDCTLFH